MRLWSLHPRYLDRIGLVAVWREGLLAQTVLRGNTRGYKHHPQLDRFKVHPAPLQAISYFLWEVFKESQVRGFNFNVSKVESHEVPQLIPVTSGQLEFELMHLLRKLEKRSKKDHEVLIHLKNIEPHPLFDVIPGETEQWEKL